MSWFMISDVAAALQGQIRYEALLWKLAPGAFPGTFDPGVLLQCICVTSPWWNEVAAILMFFDAPVQYEANTFFVINLKILGSIRSINHIFLVLFSQVRNSILIWCPKNFRARRSKSFRASLKTPENIQAHISVCDSWCAKQIEDVCNVLQEVATQPILF